MRTYLIILAFLVLVSCTGPGRTDSADLYSRAVAAMDGGDYAEAMGLAAEALDNLPQDGDTLLKADALIVMSRSHAAAGNAAASLAYAREASEFAPDYMTARRELVGAATRAGDYALALKQLDAIPDADAASVVLSRRQLVAPALASGQTDRAARALRKLYADSLWLPVEQRVALAEIFRSQGRRDSAEYIIKEVEAEKDLTPADLRALAAYYSHIGDDRRALESWHRLSLEQDSLLNALSATNIYGKLYSREHSRRIEEAESARMARMRLVLVLIVVVALVMVLVGIFLYVRTVHRRRIVEAENRILMANEELRAISERSRSTIDRLFRDSYESVEMAANMLIDSSASSNVAVALRRRLEAHVDTCRTPKFLAKLEQEINNCHDGAIERLRTRVPSLSESELNVALYCAAGLSPRVICLLLDCTPSALYNKKYRLKGKIKASGVPAGELEKFLGLID